jgi:hypothetical protein
MAALAADHVETDPARYAPDGLVVSSGNPLRRPADGTAFVLLAGVLFWLS